MPKATLWLGGLAKCIMPKKPVNICFKLIVTPLMFYLEKKFSHAFHLQAMPISLSDDQMIICKCQSSTSDI